MRTAAALIIVLSLAGFGVIVFAEFHNKSKTPSLPTEEVGRRLPPDPGAEGPIAAVTGPTVWYRDLSHAKELAQSGNKLIVVDVYTDWCGWCKKMDQIIYSDPRIAGLSHREVFLKLDAEDGGEGEDFAREMHVTGFPTTIILDGHGNKIRERKGFMQSADTFIEFVTSARSTRGSAG